jgi:hypothetical protein
VFLFNDFYPVLFALKAAGPWGLEGIHFHLQELDFLSVSVLGNKSCYKITRMPISARQGF